MERKSYITPETVNFLENELAEARKKHTAVLAALRGEQVGVRELKNQLVSILRWRKETSVIPRICRMPMR